MYYFITVKIHYFCNLKIAISYMLCKCASLHCYIITNVYLLMIKILKLKV